MRDALGKIVMRFDFLQLLFVVERHRCDAELRSGGDVLANLGRIRENNSMTRIDEFQSGDRLDFVFTRTIKRCAKFGEYTQKRCVVVAFDGVKRLK